MSTPYVWRRLTPSQRERILKHRLIHEHPWHSPPHWTDNFGHRFFLLSAACWEHQPHIGRSPERMDRFTGDLLKTFAEAGAQVLAWCVLPNHYHALVETTQLPDLLQRIGRFHGRRSYDWNAEESTRGRPNFYRCVERAMRSASHQWVTINYIHHNPVHHGYCDRWQDWPWSSAHTWLEHHGRESLARLWREYPLLDYGRSWDDASL